MRSDQDLCDQRSGIWLYPKCNGSLGEVARGEVGGVGASAGNGLI